MVIVVWYGTCFVVWDSKVMARYVMWDFEEEVARSAACSTFSSTLTSHDGLAYRSCFMMIMTICDIVRIMMMVITKR